MPFVVKETWLLMWPSSLNTRTPRSLGYTWAYLRSAKEGDNASLPQGALSEWQTFVTTPSRNHIVQEPSKLEVITVQEGERGPGE